MKTLGKYLFNVLIGFDVFTNALFGGDPRMTMSARVFIYKDVNCIARTVYRFLDWLDHDHCELSYKACQLPANNNNAVLK